MPPRITINLSEGALEIWLNPEGRDLLVQQLQSLSETSDHFHIMPEEMEPELPARNRAYRQGGEIIQWGKVSLRTDEWDARYFPHVLDQPDDKGG